MASGDAFRRRTPPNERAGPRTMCCLSSPPPPRMRSGRDRAWRHDGTSPHRSRARSCRLWSDHRQTSRDVPRVIRPALDRITGRGAFVRDFLAAGRRRVESDHALGLVPRCTVLCFATDYCRLAQNAVGCRDNDLILSAGVSRASLVVFGSVVAAMRPARAVRDAVLGICADRWCRSLVATNGARLPPFRRQRALTSRSTHLGST